MNNIVETDYKIVQERTLSVIASEIILIDQQVTKSVLDGAIQIGFKLQEAKEKVEHGQWEKWCEENLNYSKSKAEKFMRIASEYGNENSPYLNPYTCTDLSISKALKLLQVPEDQVETFAEENDISSMTVKELEEQIKVFKNKNTDLESQVTDLRNEIQSIKETDANPEKVEELKKKIAELETKTSNAIEKAKKLKEKAEAEKAKKDEEIKRLIAAESERLKTEAEQAAADRIKTAEESAEHLSEEVKQLQNKIAKASDENVLFFKLKVDQLQAIYSECEDAANKSDNPDKLITALKSVMKQLIGEN